MIATCSPGHDRWWRRAALVATTVLNTKSRGGFGDTDRTLLICGELADDRDDMVVKAESWALRALAPWDPAAVVAFLERHDVRLAAPVQARGRQQAPHGEEIGLSVDQARVTQSRSPSPGP